MGLKVSTGLANHLLSGSGLRAALAGMELRVYSGTEPASADASIGSATLLVTYSDGGTGDPLEFEPEAIGAVLEKSSSQVWQGEAVATGQATFCRLLLPSDTDGNSNTAVRLQGDVGVAGKFLNITSTSISVGAPQRCGAFAIAQPLQ